MFNHKKLVLILIIIAAAVVVTFALAINKSNEKKHADSANVEGNTVSSSSVKADEQMFRALEILLTI